MTAIDQIEEVETALNFDACELSFCDARSQSE